VTVSGGTLVTRTDFGQGEGGDDAPVSVPLESIHLGLSVRFGGFKSAYVEQIAHLGGKWPPILISRADNTIIDGHYRYLAARSLGYQVIECSYFEGDAESAFFEAVQRNLQHGLPLTLREREQAALKVLEFHHDWSDRRVAEICGLSHMTIGRLRTRHRPSDTNGHLDKMRTGRDNRVRPIDSNNVRSRIAGALARTPEASLRQIAHQVGSSPETVRSVRRELSGERANAKPVTAIYEMVRTPPVAVETPSASDVTLTDAALRATDEAKLFSDWFSNNGCADWNDHVRSVPLSRVYEVADEARRRAEDWVQFAKAVEARAKSR
jgi:ParB-like chromosome segregation protein Spo0J